jgi:hypothetical protein
MIKKITCIACLGLAVCQWIIIGERTFHAFWMYQKFKGFSGDGYTTMSLETLITGYVGSALTIALAIYISRHISGDGFCSKASKTAAVLLSCGLLWLSVLLLSPLAVVVRR